MSTSRTYLRPGGLIWGKAAADAAATGLAGLIAGGDTGFTAVEVITRDGPAVSRQWRAFADIAASSDSAIEERLHLILSSRPEMTALGLDGSCLMGIVNVTPDSFSDGGLFADAATGIAHGRKLAEAGATILDVGGESTRPYSRATAEAEERARALPVVKALAADGFKVSIDTRKPAIMRDAMAAGAILINDVAALSYAPDGVETARDLGVPVVLMHAQGTPETMQDDPRYEDVALDIFDWLEARMTACVEAGIAPGRIFLDPGIGFGKTHAHNQELLGSLTLF
ncbi:MAG: dihydropteroate synthase, partial [Parvibaculaceae bacterium]